MDYGEYESCYIREEELWLLLAGGGVEQCYLPAGGFSEDRADQTEDGAESEEVPGQTGGSRRSRGPGAMSGEDVYRILAGLYKKSYIEWENGAVRLQEPALSLAELIRDARWCLQMEMETENPEIPAIKGCYGRAGRRVLLERSPRESETLRFSLWKEDVLLAHLREVDLLPGEEDFSEADEDSQRKTPQSIAACLPEEQSFGEWLQEKGVPDTEDISAKGDGPVSGSGMSGEKEEALWEDWSGGVLPDLTKWLREGEEILTGEAGNLPERLRCAFSLRDRGTGQEAARLEVVDQGICTWTILQEGGPAKRFPYRREECEEILRRWFLREAKT